MKTNFETVELKEEACSSGGACFCGWHDSLHWSRHAAGNPGQRQVGRTQENLRVPEVGKKARAKNGKLSPTESRVIPKSSGVSGIEQSYENTWHHHRLLVERVL